MSAFSLPDLAVEQVKSMSETLHEEFFRNPAITAFHDVQEGIVAGKQMLIFKNHTGLTGYNRTGCSTTADANFAIDEVVKNWAPKYIGDRFAECYDTFLPKFFTYGFKGGVNKPDLTGTELAAFLEENIADEMQNVFLRHLWFGDTAIAATTGNNLISGQLKYFNAINGYWKQLFAIVAGDATRLTAGTVLEDRNAEASFALQKFDSTDTTNQAVTAALDQMFYDADERLTEMDPSQLVYIVTKSVFDQYVRERKSVSAIDQSYMRVENGMRVATINGIDVIPFNFQDRIIKSYLNDGTAAVLPHRAILTTRTNLVIGCETVGELEGGAMGFKPWFSDDDEKYYVRYGATLDAKVALNNMIQVCY